MGVVVVVVEEVPTYATWCVVIPKYMTFKSVAKQQNYVFHEQNKQSVSHVTFKCNDRPTLHQSVPSN